MKKINLISATLICVVALVGTLSIANAQTPTPQTQTVTTGDQIVLANTFTLAPGQVLNGSLALIGSSGSIAKGASITKSVFVVGSTISIDGSIAGDITAIGGAIDLGENAVVEGDITIVGASLARSPLAVIKGKITEQAPTVVDINPTIPAPKPVSPVGRIAGIALQSFLIAALAAILALLLPKPVKRIGEALGEQPAIAAGVGLMVVVGFMVLMVLMVITIILIPLVFLALLIFALTIFYGMAALGYELGHRIGELFHAEWAPPISTGIGTLILTLVVSSIGIIPFAGWLIMGLAVVLVILLGVGSVVMARFGSSKYRPVPRTPIHPVDTNSAQPSA